MKQNVVIVTGAYGFVGRYVAQQYSAQGWFVVGVGHGSWRKNEWNLWGIDQWHTCDITEESLASYCDKPDAIVHCAGSGSVGLSIQNPTLDFQRTVSTIQGVLEFVRIYSPKTKVIYPSSAAVYGTVQELPISEQHQLLPISPYGIHKKIAEDLCCFYGRQYNLSIAVIRLFSVYGAGLKKQLLWDACNKLKTNDNAFYGTGLETRDWIHVRDAANLFYMAFYQANSNCPIVNGGSGVAITVKEALTLLFKAFNRYDLPNFIGAENEGNPLHYHASINRIREWQWKPKVSFQEGINDYVQWYRKEGSLNCE